MGRELSSAGGGNQWEDVNWKHKPGAVSVPQACPSLSAGMLLCEHLQTLLGQGLCALCSCPEAHCRKQQGFPNAYKVVMGN